MINITWYGTATILMEIDGTKLLFDPFFRMNKKLEQPKLEEFTRVDYIFNTHPHFDHLCDLPLILKNTDAQLYGTPTAYLRLETQGVDVENQVIIIHNKEILEMENFSIKTHQSKHIDNNLGIVFLTALKVLFTFQIHKAYNLLKLHNKYRMGGDIVAFEINAQNKTILIFGSAGISNKAKLPKNVDVLIWPFQGRTNMTKYSLPIIEKIEPKTVILDHFDNAFPPITRHINTDKFVKTMAKNFPDIKVIVPKYQEKIEID